MKPRLISPLENISEATISVTTLPKTFPIPFQKLEKASKVFRILRVWQPTNTSETKRENSMAVVVLSVMGGWNRPT